MRNMTRKMMAMMVMAMIMMPMIAMMTMMTMMTMVTMVAGIRITPGCINKGKTGCKFYDMEGVLNLGMDGSPD